MSRVRLLVLIGALIGTPVPVQAQTSTPSSPVIGTWLLESIVDTLPDGSVDRWMGPHPTGAIVYSPSGYMGVQFMRDPRPGFAPGITTDADAAPGHLFDSLPPESMREVLNGYYAYFGRYQVTAAGDSVTHFVEASLRPHEVGITYRRAIRIDGDRLFISLHTEDGGFRRHRVLTWTRVP
jgi:hypothetical protein